jgi:hypothetical protein
MRDLVNNISAVHTIGPAVLSADATGTAIDLRGFNSAVVLVEVGIGGITFTSTNKVEFILQDSDDGSTGWTAVDAKYVVGVSGVASGIIRSLVAAHAAPSVVEAGYIGPKRYIRVFADFSGTHGTGTPIAVTVVRGHPTTAPA